MKVFMVTHSLSRLGIGVSWSVRRLAESVAAEGIPVGVWGLWDAWTETDTAPWCGVTVRAFRPWPPKAWGFSPALMATLEEETSSDTVLHLHGLWKATSWALLRASRRRAAPRIISARGMLAPWAVRHGGIRKTLVGWMYENRNLRSAACLHALCPAERKHLREWGVHVPVAVVPNGVDVPPLSAESSPEVQAGRKQVRRRTGGRRVVLFLSRINAKKGLLPLVDAWAQATATSPDWILVIAGPDEKGYARVVEHRIAERGLSSRVLMPGPQYGHDKEAWLREAEVGVLPSLSEGFPLTALEMLAHAVPMVLTPECHFPEASEAGAALCVLPTPESLAGALDTILRLPDAERRAMGARGRDLVEKQYAWRTIARRMVAVYRWLLGEGDRPEWVEPG